MSLEESNSMLLFNGYEPNAYGSNPAVCEHDMKHVYGTPWYECIKCGYAVKHLDCKLGKEVTDELGKI